VGITIEQEHFTQQDFDRFTNRLHKQLAVLKDLASNPSFGGDDYSFGAELELYIVDHNAKVLPINKALFNAIDDPRLTLELNKFNLELNMTPVSSKGDPFSQIEQEIIELLGKSNQIAKEFDAILVPTGILATLEESDVDVDSITDDVRYRALLNSLQKRRGKPFQIVINGEQPLRLKQNDISIEGANTSFQFHLKVPLSEYANTWNAMQLVTPLVLGFAANSPTLFGKQLWHETRIALFKQSVDARHMDSLNYRMPARVNYCYGWMRHGPWENFAEHVALFKPLLPVCSEPDHQQALSDVPSLEELRLHQGTVWSWNRAVYEPTGEGHFRIESRALPAGPSAADMAANAALLTGLTMAFTDKIEDIIVSLPFYLAEHNFYRAAQKGLDAQIMWPTQMNSQPQEMPIIDIIKDLLPEVQVGLNKLGISEQEITKQLANIEKRLDAKVSGATWQIDFLNKAKTQTSDQQALVNMQQTYIENCLKNRSISEWQL
jgi:gamma-glutamyl:cysteine ligase YbdK (ATP-grasp superfamily)